MTTTLITGGTVVSATGRGEADVLIDCENIVSVLQPGSHLLGTDLAASVDTVIDATCGRAFCGRYATVTDVSTGSPLRPLSSAFHWRYRALGLTICSPSGLRYGPSQGLQVASGDDVLPDRV